MRARSLGRWVGRLVAVAAVGAGATLGVSVATIAVDAGASGADVADVATESTGNAATDGFEWN